MIALPSDVARSYSEVQNAYQLMLESMVGLFESSLTGPPAKRRDKALTLAALCVGGMVLARTLADSRLADEVRKAARANALALIKG
jgi:hypothetical protein